MRITNAAKELGLHPRTLLNLELRGVVKPVRDRNGQRRYTEADLEKIRSYFFDRGRRRPEEVGGE